MSICNLCPRNCGIDRSKAIGFCGEKNSLRVARIAPHYYEEPCISGSKGSGTVFFSGCSLRCVFCQNRNISRNGGLGKEMSDGELYHAILELQEQGVHNINLVTPTHFVHRLAPILERLKASGDIKIPVVYNSSGYEKIETLRRLDGLVDIYMPDFKYFLPELSSKYSSAPDYAEFASGAIVEMLSQTGAYRYSQSEDGILEKGVIIRHLVLPSNRQDSINVLRHIASIINVKEVLISIMSQYTPEFALDSPYKELHRKLTSFEYDSVVKVCSELGFDGFTQGKASAVSDYTPNFK